jgi:hypothetical protein
LFGAVATLHVTPTSIVDRWVWETINNTLERIGCMLFSSALKQTNLLHIFSVHPDTGSLHQQSVVRSESGALRKENNECAKTISGERRTFAQEDTVYPSEP